MKSETFKIYELVPKKLYETVHEDVLWNMFDPKLIETIDKLKETFPDGSMVINSYKWGGDREWSGLRTKDSKWYSEGSMHSVGKAVDCVFSRYDVNSIREYILIHQDEFPHIGGIEKFDGMGWLHLDTRDRRDDNIVVFGK